MISKTIKLDNLGEKNPIAFKNTYELKILKKYNTVRVFQNLILSKAELILLHEMIEKELNIK